MDNKHQTLLLVQDNPDYVSLVSDRLTQERRVDYAVLGASTLKEALAALAQQDIDIVLLELSLPDSTGMDTYDQIHRMSPNVPVVILTGLDDEMNALQAVRAGAQDYILKGEIEGKLLTRVIYNAVARNQMRTELQNMALTDDLTELCNRRGFFMLAEQQLKLAKRKRQNLILMMVDVDSFKEINDQHGHLEGDHALKHIAEILKASLRESDIVARMGGDEFAIIAIEAGGDHIPLIVNRIQDNLDRFNQQKKRAFKLSVSVGAAVYDVDKIAFVEQLIAKADEDLYLNKRQKTKKSS